MNPRRPPLSARLLLPVCLALAADARGEAPTLRELSTWFEPDRVQQATLAPDGRHLAYTVHEEGKTTIVLVDVDDPSKGARVPVGEDAIVHDSHDTEKTPMRVPFLRWAAPDRLVFSAEITDIPVVDVRRINPPTNVVVVYAVDADGRNLTKLANDDDLALVATSDTPDADTNGADSLDLPREPRVIGFAADDPDAVLVEAVRPALGTATNDPNLYGRLATGLFKINVRTGKRQVMHEQDVNGALLYDRQGNARIEVLRPIDKRVQTFVYLAPPRGQADGKGLDKLLGDDISPENYLGARTFPVGFDYDPNILYVASNAGRDTYGLYALDLRAGTRTLFAVENPVVDVADFETPFSDAPLVFDRGRRRLVGVRVAGLEESTHWLDADLAGVQSVLDGKFPGRSVRLVDWDDGRARFLALVFGAGDPGRYYVFKRAENRLVQFVRRAPQVDLEDTNPALAFAFDTPEGVHLTGYLTLPHTPRVNPSPLLVYCHPGPWQRVAPGFNHDAQVLAAMGFVVVQVNYRGSAGFGTQHREALRSGIDHVPIDDLRAAIAWVTARHPIDRKRVALLGQGFGGYLALRALQLYPDDFRCAVAINAPTDLEAWCRRPESRQEAIDRQQDTVNYLHQQGTYMLNVGRPTSGPLALAKTRVPSYSQQGGAAGAPAAAATSGAGSAANGSVNTAPVQAPLPPPDLVNFASEFRRWYFGTDAARLAAISPARHPELITKPVLLIQDPRDLDGEAGESGALRSALSHTNNPADYLETTGAFTRGLPEARTEVFAKIEDFFDQNLYDFNVKVGEPKVQK
jgi:dipeptidyl aminopeptidase/acylaminoacyl peptidase